MEPTPEFERAEQIIEFTDTNLFLTGKAGTGKTTFLRHLVEHSSKRLVVLAPTGIAAINAGGSTVHSFFQINPGEPYIPDEQYQYAQKDAFKINRQKLNIIKSLDLIVIDEISMVRADLLDAVDATLRRFRRNTKPFGGVQLLMIGDLQQLSPVVRDDEWRLVSKYYKTPFFFGSIALQHTNYITIELKKVFRQSDNCFLELLNKVRDDQMDENTLAELNKRYIADFQPNKDDGYINLVTHNRQANEINQQEMEALKGNTYVYECEVRGNFPESSFPVERELRLKKGAQVMFVKNDQYHRYFNGMIGTITQIDETGFVVKPNKQTLVADGYTPEDEIEVGRETWENNRYIINEETKLIETQIDGTFSQFPVKLAWAITIHKSQGLTFERTIIDAHSAFAHGQTYVALSRCKTLEGIVLSSPIPKDAIINDRAVRNYTEEQSKKQVSEADVDVMQLNFKINLLDDLFDFGVFGSTLNYYVRVLNEHYFKNYSSEINELIALRKDFDENVKAVAGRFSAQYRKIVTDKDENMLQERLQKAGEYFSEQIVPLATFVVSHHFESDNQAVKKQFSHALEDLREQLRMKSQLLDYVSKNEFEVKTYLAVRGKIAVGDSLLDMKKLLKKRKPKVPKEEKVSTTEQTFLLWKDGKTVEEIAELRNLTKTTIFSHLTKLVVEGRIPIGKVMSLERVNQVADFLKHTPNVSKVPYLELREALGGDFSYGEIRMVREWMACQEE